MSRYLPHSAATRRELLACASAASVPPRSSNLVVKVEVRTVWKGRDGPGPTWSSPQPIPGMGRKTHPDGIEEGVCDTVPEYHPKTRTVLAIGHNVYYKVGKLTRPDTQRWPVYTALHARDGWSEPRRLEWDNSDASAIYTCGCAQRLTLAGGDILVPLSYGPVGRADRAVTTVLCSFDGHELKVKSRGTELRHAVKRGLLEPSLARLGEPLSHDHPRRRRSRICHHARRRFALG